MILTRLAETAYTAFSIAAGDVNRGSQPLVPWDDLELDHRRYWLAAVKAMLLKCAVEIGAEFD